MGPGDLTRPKRGFLTTYRGESVFSHMANFMLYNFPHSMGSEKTILTIFQKKTRCSQNKMSANFVHGLNAASWPPTEPKMCFPIWHISCSTTSPIVWALQKSILTTFQKKAHCSQNTNSANCVHGLNAASWPPTEPKIVFPISQISCSTTSP